MASNKKTLLLLLVIALVYVFVASLGILTGDDREGDAPPRSGDELKDWVNNTNLNQWIDNQRIAGLLDLLPKPKLELEQNSIEVYPTRLSKLKVSERRDDKYEYRQIIFDLVEGKNFNKESSDRERVEIRYHPSSADEHNGEDVLEFTIDANKSERFAVGPSGGEFTFKFEPGKQGNRSASILLN